MIASVALAAFVLRGTLGDARRLMIPWLLIQAFALTNAAAAVVRTTIDENPIQPRYAAIPAVYWAALSAQIAFILWRSWPTTPRARAGQVMALAVLVLSLALPTYRSGLRLFDFLVNRAAYHPVVARAIVHEVHDDDMLRRLTAYPEDVWLLRPIWRALGHVPFDRPLPEEPRSIELPAPNDARTIPGHLDGIRIIDDHFIRACGWAFSPRDQVAEIVLVDDTGTVRGTGVGGLPRSDLVRHFGKRAGHAGWCGYARTDAARGTLTALARVAAGSAYSPLIGTHPFSRD